MKDWEEIDIGIAGFLCGLLSGFVAGAAIATMAAWML